MIGGAAYVERLNNPTDWTRIKPDSGRGPYVRQWLEADAATWARTMAAETTVNLSRLMYGLAWLAGGRS